MNRGSRPRFGTALTLFLAGLVCFVVTLALPLSALAADREYEQAVVATRGLVREAIGGARERVPEAIATLENGTGSSQPEILADLRRTPPDLADADARLAAVEAALNRPGDAGSPEPVRGQVHRIITLPRYDSMRGGLSPLDRLIAWALRQVAEFLLVLALGTHLPAWIFDVLVGGLTLLALAVTVMLARGSWTRGSSARAERADQLRAGVRNRFAAADRLSSERAFAAALRELVAAVAGEIGRRPFWESSPLTVRELFRDRGLLDELRPLLVPFEASVYGRRDVSEDEYGAALRAAAPYRAGFSTTEAAA